MIISHSKQFIFIHVYKIAGTSIKEALYQYADGKIPQFKRLLIGISKNHQYFSSNFDPHIKACQLKELIPKRLFKNYFKFAFVRDPYDWQVSLFSYMKQHTDHYQHEIVNSMNFKEYLYWRVEKDLSLQSDFLFNGEGDCVVDFIGKIEKLEYDFKYVLNKLGLKNVSLEHLNKSQRARYIDYYDKECYELINQAYDKDFKLLNYKKIVS